MQKQYPPRLLPLSKQGNHGLPRAQAVKPIGKDRQDEALQDDTVAHHSKVASHSFTANRLSLCFGYVSESRMRQNGCPVGGEGGRHRVEVRDLVG